MPEMNEFAKRWVEALLSGKYKQGKGCLRTADNEFCCLGVALDVMAPEGWADTLVPVRTHYRDNAVQVLSAYTYGPDGEHQIMPDDMWEKLTEGGWRLAGMQSDIAAANDHGATFKEIVEQYILPMWQTEEEVNGGA